MSTLAADTTPPAPRGPGAEISTRQLGKISVASFLATTIEWYDFYLYGMLAALVFPEVFFSDVSPAVGAVLSFATFAAGFISRPIGALIFGHIGDRFSRKTMLAAALITAGLVSFAIAAVPGYASIGVAGAVILTVLRFVQGLAVGGQWGGAVLLISERAPAKRRGLWASVAQQGVPGGLILSGLAISILTSTLDKAAFAAWGWRLPFIVGGVLTAIALVLILRVEKIAGQAVGQTAQRRPTLRHLFVKFPKPLFVGFAAQLGLTTGAYVLGTWTLNYVTTLSAHPVPRAEIMWPSTISPALSIVLIFAFSWLSDRVGRKTIMLSGFVLAIVMVYPLLLAYQSGSIPLIWLAVFAYQIPHSMMFGPLAALLTELFPRDVRASGISIGYQLGGTLGGGIGALVASALFLATGGITWIAVYTAAALAIGFIGVWIARETRGEILDAAPDPANVEATGASKHELASA
jgi:MFS family permease